MDLELFTPETCPTDKSHKKSRTPQISIGKTGVFQISCEAAKRIGLLDGEEVIISADKKEPDNWYIGKAKKGKGWTVRPVKTNKLALQFNSSALSKKMREALGVKEIVSIKFILAGQPTLHKESGVTFYGLILKPII